MAMTTLTVTVRFYGPIARRPDAPGKTRERRDVLEGTTAGQLLTKLGVQHQAEVSIVVEGRVVGLDYLVRDGDELLVLPELAGG
jgi:molybdopterin converting factor small subunit